MKCTKERGRKIQPKDYMKKWETIFNHRLPKFNSNIPLLYPFSPNQEVSLQEYPNVYNQTIDYSDYAPLSPNSIAEKDMYTYFHGILQYIHYRSQNQLNSTEMSFFLSEQRFGYSKTEAQKPNLRGIFDYADDKTFLSVFGNPAFLGITFKRIKVIPIAYSLRSDFFYHQNPHLNEFIFEAYDDENNEWDILDEKININDLYYSGNFAIYLVQSTNKLYSSFRIRETSFSHVPTWGFTLAGFEIHGYVIPNDNKELEDDIKSFSTISATYETSDTDSYETPTSDSTQDELIDINSDLSMYLL